MTLQELEADLSAQKLRFVYAQNTPQQLNLFLSPKAPKGCYSFRHDFAEINPFPPQAQLFWSLVGEKSGVPSQDEYVKGFFETYSKEKRWTGFFSNPDTRLYYGIEARVRRSFPSFVREYHLGIVLNNLFGNERVRRDHELDRMGADFGVTGRNGGLVCLRTYVSSVRAKQFAAQKRRITDLGDYRHACIVDLVLDGSCKKVVGQYHLYDEKAVAHRLQEFI